MAEMLSSSPADVAEVVSTLGSVRAPQPTPAAVAATFLPAGLLPPALRVQTAELCTLLDEYERSAIVLGESKFHDTVVYHVYPAGPIKGLWKSPIKVLGSLIHVSAKPGTWPAAIVKNGIVGVVHVALVDS
jgi:hypothetical protein